MLCDVNTLSCQQTMRRQRTEVVVELRKVNRYGVIIAFCLWKNRKNTMHKCLHVQPFYFCYISTEQKRRTPSEEEKCAL